VIGDRGILFEGPCPCGSVFPRIDEMITRAGVMFVKSDDGMGAEARSIPPQLIVQRCRSIQGDAHLELVTDKELAEGFVEQQRVGLQQVLAANTA
jgi:hypothetical protein